MPKAKLAIAELRRDPHPHSPISLPFCSYRKAQKRGPQLKDNGGVIWLQSPELKLLLPVSSTSIPSQGAQNCPAGPGRATPQDLSRLRQKVVCKVPIMVTSKCKYQSTLQTKRAFPQAV